MSKNQALHDVWTAPRPDSLKWGQGAFLEHALSRKACPGDSMLSGAWAATYNFAGDKKRTADRHLACTQIKEERPGHDAVAPDTQDVRWPHIEQARSEFTRALKNIGS